MRVTRLTSEFQRSVQRFNHIQKQIVMKMKTTALPTPNNAALMDEESQQQALLDAEAERQAQLRLQQELEFEQGLLLERENRVRQIETDIVDCNDIMRELAKLVNEQAEAVGTKVYLQMEICSHLHYLNKDDVVLNLVRFEYFCMKILCGLALADYQILFV